MPISPNAQSSRLRRLTTTLAAASSVSALSLAALVMEPVALRHLDAQGWSAAAQAATPRTHLNDFADIVARVKPSVISVEVELDDTQQVIGNAEDAPPNNNRDGAVMVGQGSGFFISADGYAVTNNHVVDHARLVAVTTNDGQTYSAKVIGTDPKTDLALIKVEGGDFPHVNFAEGRPRVGNWVVAIGNPYGLGGTVTAGIVSAEGRDIGAGPYDDFIQIDAPINRGNSGGPAFDVNGDVIGVNTAIFSPSGGSVGIGFDIPADTAKAVIAELKDKGYVTRGWLGIQQQQITPDIADSLGLKQTKGALIDVADPLGPAGKAGVKPGDVITAVDGNAINDPRELAQKIAKMAPGRLTTLTVQRGGTAQDISVALGTMPNERPPGVVRASEKGTTSPNEHGLGLLTAPASKVAGPDQKGLVVVAVDPNGEAAQHGLSTGDIILDVGGKAVSNAKDFLQDLIALRQEGKSAALVRIQSGDSIRFVALPLQQV